MSPQGQARDRLWWAPASLRPFVRTVGHRALSGVGSIASVRTKHPLLALTFDDGPCPEHTPGIVDVLRRHRVRATFFQLASQAGEYPELARSVVAEGHEVALHGNDHSRLDRRALGHVRESVRLGRQRLEGIIERPVRWFRPPFGSQSPRSYAAVRSLGLEVVVWSGLGYDWLDLPAGDVVRHVDAACHPGAIILLHDAQRSLPIPTFDRAAVVDELLGSLKRRGLTPVTVQELVRAGKKEKRAWFKH